jgi:asparagine synthase (glutamine-hydrolysing)
MCGFAGLLTTAGYRPDELAAHAARMTAPLAHRGPDDSGVWSDAAAGIALGFRRLAIVDLSPHGHQPMASPSRRYVMVFNGELYNFTELRRELELRGYTFRGHSDTEVILAAFEEWGIDAAVRRFIGMFAIAVWDTRRRELSLLRDRMGKKPLYVYHEPGLISFGSELKALVAGPSFDRSIDREALASYFRYFYIPAPKSIFARAFKLPAAHVLTIADARIAPPPARPYWSLREVAARGLANRIASEADAIDELDRLLVQAVKCRLHVDVPLGALLSGGIDSSTVVALMQETSSRPVKTYTIGVEDREFDEARHAERVARHLGTDHTELVLSGGDALDLIPQLPEIFDEPLADPSQVPTCLVARLARQHVTVALCGDGGDELFGGYNRYVYGTRMLPRVGRVPQAIRRRLGAGIGRIPSTTWDRIGRLAGRVPGVPGGRIGERVHKLGNVMAAGSVGDMYRSLLSPWQHADVLLDAPVFDDENERILDEREPADLLDRMLLADQILYLPDDQLARVDRASMAASLELRSPLLDHRVAEFSWRIPPSLKLRGTAGKWILRQVLHRRIPKEIVDRPKMGFSIPVDRWLRGALRPWAESLLAEDAIRREGLLDPVLIGRAWSDLQQGRRQTGMALWAVIMFQAWNARWRTSPAAVAPVATERACA